jgi:3-oxoacyl-[acyl-carrier protein] reductase
MESTGSVAVVTGASRGIGRVVAERLVTSGHTVIAVGRAEAQLAQVAATCGAVPLTLDVTDVAGVATAWQRLESEYGVPTLLVNNAGLSGTSGRTWEQDPRDWWPVFEVNVLGAFLCSRAALPSMIEQGHGRIVNVSSNAAFYPVLGEADGMINSAYMASKAALIRFSETLAGETAGTGVTAFAISPGTVKTDMTAGIFAAEWDDPDLWSPPELTADLIEHIDSGALDALSGRYIHAARDDWRTMGSRADEISEGDLHTLRVRGT